MHKNTVSKKVCHFSFDIAAEVKQDLVNENLSTVECKTNKEIIKLLCKTAADYRYRKH